MLLGYTTLAYVAIPQQHLPSRKLKEAGAGPGALLALRCGAREIQVLAGAGPSTPVLTRFSCWLLASLLGLATFCLLCP